MQKFEQSSCQMVMCHLVANLGVDSEKATQLIDEMEQPGFIRFDGLCEGLVVKFSNANSFKAKIENIAKEKGISFSKD